MVSKQIFTLDVFNLASGNTVGNPGVIYDQAMSFNTTLNKCAGLLSFI